MAPAPTTPDRRSTLVLAVPDRAPVLPQHRRPPRTRPQPPGPDRAGTRRRPTTGPARHHRRPQRRPHRPATPDEPGRMGAVAARQHRPGTVFVSHLRPSTLGPAPHRSARFRRPRTHFCAVAAVGEHQAHHPCLPGLRRPVRTVGDPPDRTAAADTRVSHPQAPTRILRRAPTPTGALGHRRTGHPGDHWPRGNLGHAHRPGAGRRHRPPAAVGGACRGLVPHAAHPARRTVHPVPGRRTRQRGPAPHLDHRRPQAPTGTDHHLRRT